MGFLIYLMSCLICIQMVRPFPIQDGLSPLLEDYKMRLAKREPFNPFKESLLSSLGLLENPRDGTQSQRKKAVDSTFIRFGRSSSGEKNGKEGSVESPSTIPEMPDTPPDMADRNMATSPQRFILDHNGCRVSSSRELVRALMNDRNCIRAFQKVKRENVNDTFMGFGKREAPAEKEFESENSDESPYAR